MPGGSTPSRRFGHTTVGRNRHPHVHVWVSPGQSPGVLVAWAQLENGDWQAQVVYVEAGRVITAWLPADMVRRA